MAEKLQKYKYGGNTSRSARATRQTTQTPGNLDQPSPTRTERGGMSAEEIKTDILSSLRREISKIIREEQVHWRRTSTP